MHVAGGWHYDPQSQQLQITLDQTGNQELYRMPIDVAISLPQGASTAGATESMTNAGPRGRDSEGPTMQTATILVDKRHNTLSVPLTVAPTNVELDPNLWVPMMQATFEKQ